jgi:hypothetical protein
MSFLSNLFGAGKRQLKLDLATAQRSVAALESKAEADLAKRRTEVQLHLNVVTKALEDAVATAAPEVKTAVEAALSAAVPKIVAALA